MDEILDAWPGGMDLGAAAPGVDGLAPEGKMTMGFVVAFGDGEKER